jgi:formylglycine-generating enzyme required for sulfatase activity
LCLLAACAEPVSILLLEMLVNGLPRQKLRELIVQYGRSLCDDPRRCEALLKDYCGQYKREIFVLVNALKNRVAEDLNNTSAGVPPALVVGRLIQRLEDELGLAENAARWAVETWALALGIMPVESVEQPRPALETPRPPVAPLAPSSLKPFTVFRDQLRDGSDGPAMIVIPAGEFWMGSPESEQGRDNDEYRHRVRVLSFAIGQYPITFEEYDRFCTATDREKPSDSGWGRDSRPVINVSWHDAIEYAEWLSKARLYRQRYRLPTEAEWEYAARAGTQTAYWWGKELGYNQANCNGSGSHWSGKQTAPVGSFQPNPWGLYDTVGNVREWTGSLYQEKYDGAETRCVGKDEVGLRAARGGSWSDEPMWARSAYRNKFAPISRYFTLGFRLARSF